MNKHYGAFSFLIFPLFDLEDGGDRLCGLVGRVPGC
jgi:hypothetical protein